MNTEMTFARKLAALVVEALFCAIVAVLLSLFLFFPWWAVLLFYAGLFLLLAHR